MLDIFFLERKSAKGLGIKDLVHERIKLAC